eukprot:snap_masked-scaffold_3-processed-gene-10.15-mRNA-1 protein AED:1.00 eAED:1.00 QI:0/-1/0/0/-1/1/1/0/558
MKTAKQDLVGISLSSTKESFLTIAPNSSLQNNFFKAFNSDFFHEREEIVHSKSFISETVIPNRILPAQARKVDLKLCNIPRIKFTEKYKPKIFFDLLIPLDVSREVLQFFVQWNKYLKSLKRRKKLEKPTNQVLILNGNAGLGKTTCIRICAEKASFLVKEVNASDNRSVNTLRPEIENLRNKKLNSSSLTGLDKRECVLVLDEADGIDKAVVHFLIRMLKSTKENALRDRPLVFICNDFYGSVLRTLTKELQGVHLLNVRDRRSSLGLKKRLKFICEEENLPANGVDFILEHLKEDIRACLNFLEYFKLGNRKKRNTLELCKLLPKCMKDSNQSASFFEVINAIFQKKKKREKILKNSCLDLDLCLAGLNQIVLQNQIHDPDFACLSEVMENLSYFCVANSPLSLVSLGLEDYIRKLGKYERLNFAFPSDVLQFKKNRFTNLTLVQGKELSRRHLHSFVQSILTEKPSYKKDSLCNLGESSFSQLFSLKEKGVREPSFTPVKRKIEKKTHFLSERIENKENHNGNSGQKIVYFKYQTGFANAVRRKVTISEFFPVKK